MERRRHSRHAQHTHYTFTGVRTMRMVCSVKIDSSCKGVLTDRQTSRPACRRCRLDGRAPRPPRGMPYSRELRLSPPRGESRGRADTRKRAHRTHTRTKSTRDTSRTPTYIKCSSHAGAPPVPHRGTPHPWPHRLRPSRTPGSDQVVVVEWGSHCILPYMRAPCPGWVFAIR